MQARERCLVRSGALGISAYDVVYDVMIGDNVSFNDFNERYEIISQNGNIYTVKERTK